MKAKRSLGGDYNFMSETAAPTPSSPELSKVETAEAVTFGIIDRERAAILGIFAANLSDVQSVTTNPTILDAQTSRMFVNAQTAIDGSIETKKLLRQAGIARATRVAKKDVELDAPDLEVSKTDRHALIIEALLINRTLRESQLEQQIKALRNDAELQRNKLEIYRASLVSESPEALKAFDEQFSLAELTTFDDILTPTGELELIAYADEQQDERLHPPTGAKAIIALATKAIKSVMDKVA